MRCTQTKWGFIRMCARAYPTFESRNTEYTRVFADTKSLPIRHGMTQSRIMSRLRINFFAWVMSWFDLNKKSGSCFSHESIWILEIHLSHELILSQFWKAAWVMSWIDSSLQDTAWVMSWFESTFWKALEWKAQKRSYQVNSKVECPKKVKWNWEWIASLTHELIWIKILKSFFESWVYLNQNSGSSLSRESIWIKFPTPILSRELIWIKSCKVIMNHELSRIITFWDSVESK